MFYILTDAKATIRNLVYGGPECTSKNNFGVHNIIKQGPIVDRAVEITTYIYCIFLTYLSKSDLSLILPDKKTLAFSLPK